MKIPAFRLNSSSSVNPSTALIPGERIRGLGGNIFGGFSHESSKILSNFNHLPCYYRLSGDRRVLNFDYGVVFRFHIGTMFPPFLSHFHNILSQMPSSILVPGSLILIPELGCAVVILHMSPVMNVNITETRENKFST